CPPSFPRACHRTAAMRLRLTEIDRPLTAVVVALAAYGLATLYSAGQTDVPTFVTTIWQRQLIWLGVGLVAVVLMFRTSPRLRELLPPCLIAGVPTLLVAKQPDLGSAIVFIAILFAMLYWAGTKPSLLVLLGSPVIGLVLAFSTVAWGAWIIVLLALLLWWRP